MRCIQSQEQSPAAIWYSGWEVAGRPVLLSSGPFGGGGRTADELCDTFVGVACSHDRESAWGTIQRITGLRGRGRGATPPALARLVEGILARYPNWADLPDELLDDEHQVWSDGRIRADGPLLVLGICRAWVERVQPFVVSEANRLGLVCYDMQLGQVYLPAASDAEPLSWPPNMTENDDGFAQGQR